MFRVLLFVSLALTLLKCGSSDSTEYLKINGLAQGTSYQIVYGKTDQNYSDEIAALLVAFDQSLSTYLKDSEISKINRNEIQKMDKWIYSVIQRSRFWNQQSGGAFDITSGPLVKFYGFDNGTKDDKAPLDSILSYVGMRLIEINTDSLLFKPEQVQLDVNAIAQGYAVDIVCDFLTNKNIHNYMVEIGGEVRCKGLNPFGKNWRIGIDMPDGSSVVGDREIINSVLLDGLALATSGNYRKAIEKDGVTYTHTIDPRNGLMVQSDLLSASILAISCIDADAVATTCMVLGLDDAYEFVSSQSQMEGLFIYKQNHQLEIKMTEGFRQILYLAEND